jgi:hypothetical protein
VHVFITNRLPRTSGSAKSLRDFAASQDRMGDQPPPLRAQGFFRILNRLFDFVVKKF